jgi:hypothetical protein
MRCRLALAGPQGSFQLFAKPLVFLLGKRLVNHPFGGNLRAFKLEG